MADKKRLLGPQPSKKGLLGPQPGKTGLLGPEPSKTGLLGPEPSKTGLLGPEPSKTGLLGPEPSKTGLLGPEPSKTGLLGPEPSKTGLLGPEPSKTGLLGPEPSKTGLLGPEPSKTGLLGPEPSKTGLLGPEPSKKGLLGPEPSKKGLLGPEPSKTGLLGPEPSKKGLLGPEPSKKGLLGPKPSKKGLLRPEPSKTRLLGPEPSKKGLLGPEPSKTGLLGPEPSKEGLLGPEPSKTGLLGPKPSKKGLSGPEPSKTGLLGPEPSKKWLSGPEPCKKWLSGPEPKKKWLSALEPSKTGLLGLEPKKKWLSGHEPNKKVLLTPEPNMKWLLVPGPNKKGLLGPETKRGLVGPTSLEPMPLGMNCKPWYKDRDKLPSHYFAKGKNRFLRCPTSLDSRRWIFVKEGLDDFRTGCPSCENMITRGPREGFLPTIAHRIPRPPPKRRQNNLPKGADLCSKLSPAQQARKAFVEGIEASLTKHPLARYPNLKESLPADLLLKVLEVLDPDRKLEDTWDYCLRARERKTSSTNLYEKYLEEVNRELPDEVDLEPPGEVDLEPPAEVDLEPPAEVDLEPPAEVDLEPPAEVNLEPPKESLLSYITKLFPEEKKQKKSSRSSFPKGPSLYQRTPREVRKFCKWINDTFGDMGIDEEYIMKQFEIDHECTPTHNTVKIKKVSQIPLEIKYSTQLDKIKERKFSLQEDSWERKLRKRQNPYKPKRVKIRYGAWYLEPKSWKKLINNEPLIDPKVLLEEEYWNYKRYLEPGIIDDLYGPIAFKDFIISKGYRMPGVLKKLFFRKGWTYDSVKTPFHRVMKLLSKTNDEEWEDD